MAAATEPAAETTVPASTEAPQEAAGNSNTGVIVGIARRSRPSWRRRGNRGKEEKELKIRNRIPGGYTSAVYPLTVYQGGFYETVSHCDSMLRDAAEPDRPAAAKRAART